MSANDFSASKVYCNRFAITRKNKERLLQTNYRTKMKNEDNSIRNIEKKMREFVDRKWKNQWDNEKNRIWTNICCFICDRCKINSDVTRNNLSTYRIVEKKTENCLSNCKTNATNYCSSTEKILTNDEFDENENVRQLTQWCNETCRRIDCCWSYSQSANWYCNDYMM